MGSSTVRARKARKRRRAKGFSPRGSRNHSRGSRDPSSGGSTCGMKSGFSGSRLRPARRPQVSSANRAIIQPSGCPLAVARRGRRLGAFLRVALEGQQLVGEPGASGPGGHAAAFLQRGQLGGGDGADQVLGVGPGGPGAVPGAEHQDRLAQAGDPVIGRSVAHGALPAAVGGRGEARGKQTRQAAHVRVRLRQAPALAGQDAHRLARPSRGRALRPARAPACRCSRRPAAGPAGSGRQMSRGRASARRSARRQESRWPSRCTLVAFSFRRSRSSRGGQGLQQVLVAPRRRDCASSPGNSR